MSYRLRTLSSDGRLAVVGESHYQPALVAAANGHAAGTGLDGTIPVRAALHPEPDNPFDRNAVAVVVLTGAGPLQVGHLARPDAAQYQPVLLTLLRQGFIGTCPARITGGGAGRSYGIYLHLAPPSSILIENDLPANVLLLEPERNVTVTREQDHQDALEHYRPREGQSRRVYVEFGHCVVATGKYAGQPALEVRLDGHRVGELTAKMSERYGGYLDYQINRGDRFACEAVVHVGKRGLELELRLPNVTDDQRVTSRAINADEGTRAGATLPYSGVTPERSHQERPPSLVTEVSPAARNAPRVRAQHQTPPLPPRRSAGSTVAPAGPDPSATKKRRRKYALVGGSVFGVLVLIGSFSDDEVASPGAALTATASSTSTTPPQISAQMTSVSPSVTPPPVAAPEPAPVDTPQTRQAPPVPLPAPAPSPQRSPQRQTPPPPPPAPAPAPAREPISGCDANYSGCVPIASDVDCAGGSGNGPEYVAGPIRVLGDDVYGLDSNNDGVACE